MTWSAPTPDCVSCNGTVAPDGYCWDCGAAQPAFRAHIERELETGAAAVTDRGLRRGTNADVGADAPNPTARTRSLRPTTPGSLLLCTDGLWRYLPTAEAIRAKLTGNPTTDTRALTRHALDSGGHDNITALIIPWP